jgi:hypothetical protein
MLSTLFTVFAVLLLGPALAFGMLAIGCSGDSPALGVACGHNAVVSLVGLSVAFWFILTMALSVRSALKNKL